MEATIQMLFLNNIHIDYNKANNRAYIATLKKVIIYFRLQ